MVKVTNIVGNIIRPLGALSEDFTVQGLLLPKDKISRNGILYDWDSVKAHAKDFEGVCLNYNHIIDDDKPPIGKIKKTWVKEEDDEAGEAGVYYRAEIDEDSEYSGSIRKGHLNKVSIQVQADAQKNEKDDNGETYTRAFVGEPLEVSVVKVPGFNETTMEVALAEAFKIKESGQTTSGNAGGSQVMIPKKKNNDYDKTTEESVDEDNKMTEEDKVKKETTEAPEEVKEEAVEETTEESVEEPVKEEESLSEEADEPSDMDKLVDVVEALNDRVGKLEEAGNEVEDTVEESNEEDEETKSESDSEDEDAVKEDATEVEDTKEESDTPQLEQDAKTTPSVKTDANPVEPSVADVQNKSGNEDKITKNEGVESEEEPKAESVEDEETKEESVEEDETKESVDGETKEESEDEESEEEKPKAPIVESMKLSSIGYKSKTNSEGLTNAIKKIF